MKQRTRAEKTEIILSYWKWDYEANIYDSPWGSTEPIMSYLDDARKLLESLSDDMFEKQWESGYGVVWK